MEKELEKRIKLLEQKLDILSDQLNKALIYIEDDPHSSLTKSRTILEQILSRIYKLEMGQEPKRIELGAILTDNQFTRKIDRRILSRMNAIRDMCNLGVHGEKVIPKDAKIVLDSLCEVLDWYFENYETIKPENEKLDRPSKTKRKQNKRIIIIFSVIFIVMVFSFLTIQYLRRTEDINIKGKYYGLIIGIDEYDDSLITDLQNQVRDAEMFYNVITTRYTFDTENVKFLKNATFIEMVSALDFFAKKVTYDDSFIIFYSGHGVWDDAVQMGYWLPSDARKSSKLAWFRNSTLRDYLQGISAKHILLVSDACFGGSLFNARTTFIYPTVPINLLYNIPSRKAIISGHFTEISDQSPFIKYLTDRLLNNEEKYLSAEQLFCSIRTSVINNSTVVPQFGDIKDVGDEGGDFIFVLK